MWPDKTVNPHGIPPRDPAAEPTHERTHREALEDEVADLRRELEEAREGYSRRGDQREEWRQRAIRAEKREQRLREALERALAELEKVFDPTRGDLDSALEILRAALSDPESPSVSGEGCPTCGGARDDPDNEVTGYAGDQPMREDCPDYFHRQPPSVSGERPTNDDPDVLALAEILARKAWPGASNRHLRALERKLYAAEARIDTLTAERDGYREALEVFAATPEDYSNDDIRSLARAALAPDDSE